MKSKRHFSLGLRFGDSILQFATFHPRASNNHGAADVDIFSSDGANLQRINTSFFVYHLKQSQMQQIALAKNLELDQKPNILRRIFVCPAGQHRIQYWTFCMCLRRGYTQWTNKANWNCIRKIFFLAWHLVSLLYLS